MAGNLNWSGVAELSPRVKDYALTILRDGILNPTSKFYLKYLDTMGADREAAGTITEDDIMFKIYGNKK